MKLLEDKLNLAPADAIALLSICGDVRLGGFYGIPHVTTRLEIPRHLNVAPDGLRKGTI